MTDINERLADRFIRHDIELERLFAGVQRDTVRRITTLSDELRDLVFRVDPTQPLRLRFRRQRVRKLIEEARDVVRKAYKDLAATDKATQRRLLRIEALASRTLVNDSVEFELATVALNPEQVDALVSNVLIEGAPSREWWARQDKQTMQRFADQMRVGVRNGETIEQLGRRMRERAFKGVARQQALTLVRTSFQAVTNAARTATFEANAGVLRALQQRSTLDGRTTDICIAYSGKAWTLPDFEPDGHDLPFNGGPPRHFRCRSTTVPITKSWEELSEGRLPSGDGNPSQSLNRRFKKNLRSRGLSEDAIKRAQRKTQAAMGGQVSRDLDFEAWLSSKTESFQRSVLGPGKWKLWKQGRITSLRQLLDQRGRPLTLEQMEARFLPGS